MKKAILILTLLCLAIYVLNHFLGIDTFVYIGQLINPTFIFLFSGLVLFGLTWFLKTLKKRLFFLSVFLLTISLFLGLMDTLAIQKNKKLQYSSIDSCFEMENKFEDDLKNKELKFFTYGFSTDKKLNNYLKRKYNIQTYHKGCVVFGVPLCYNEKVNQYLINNYNDYKINEIYHAQTALRPEEYYFDFDKIEHYNIELESDLDYNNYEK